MLFRDDDDDDANKKTDCMKKGKIKIIKKKSITNQWLLKLNRIGKKYFFPYLNLTLWLHIVRFTFSSNILLLNRLIAVSWL